MGAYLSVPVTEKERWSGQGTLKGHSDEHLKVLYGGAAMQGWRRTMEDAHVCQCVGGDTGIFGVFDGHGGAEVALFCQRYMAQELSKLDSFTGRDRVECSLVDVFHRMDDMLRDHSFADEIEQLKAREPDEDEDQDHTMSYTPAYLDMIRKAFQLRRFIGDSANSNSQPGGVRDAPTAGTADEAVAMEADAGEAQQQQDGEKADAGSGGQAGTSPAADHAQQRVVEPADARIQAGCTAVVAVIKGGHLYVANAGDSRGVLCRGGTAVAMSEDHKPASETERNRILNAGGFLSDIGGVCRVNGNLNLSRAIGDLRYKSNQTLHAKDQIITAEPDVTKVALQEEDEFLLLACDGVWDVMENQQAVDFLRERLANGVAPADAACELLDRCLANDPKEARGVGCDNMTAIVVQLRRGGDGTGSGGGGGGGGGSGAGAG